MIDFTVRCFKTLETKDLLYFNCISQKKPKNKTIKNVII